MRVNIRDIQLNIERRYFQTEVSAPTLEDLYASLSVQIGEEYLIGTLEPDTDPADFDERNWTVYFLAGEPGTYTYLQDDSDNDMVVETYEIVLFKKAWEGGWEKIVIYSCGSGVCPTYTNPTPVPVTIGGILENQTFDEVPLQDMWTMLLYPYLEPAFTNFKIAGQNTSIGYFDEIPDTGKFTWDTANGSNLQPDSISIKNITLSETIVSDLANAGEYDYNFGSPIGVDAVGWGNCMVFEISGKDTRNRTISATFSVCWTSLHTLPVFSAFTFNGQSPLELTETDPSHVGDTVTFAWTIDSLTYVDQTAALVIKDADGETLFSGFPTELSDSEAVELEVMTNASHGPSTTFTIEAKDIIGRAFIKTVLVTWTPLPVPVLSYFQFEGANPKQYSQLQYSPENPTVTWGFTNPDSVDNSQPVVITIDASSGLTGVPSLSWTETPSTGSKQLTGLPSFLGTQNSYIRFKITAYSKTGAVISGQTTVRVEWYNIVFSAPYFQSFAVSPSSFETGQSCGTVTFSWRVANVGYLNPDSIQIYNITDGGAKVYDGSGQGHHAGGVATASASVALNITKYSPIDVVFEIRAVNNVNGDAVETYTTYIRWYEPAPTPYRVELVSNYAISSIVLSGGGSYIPNSTVYINVSNSHPDYEFVKWEFVSGIDVTSGWSTNPNQSFNMPEGNVKLMAVFEYNPEPDPVKLSVSRTPGGTVNIYQEGTSVILQINKSYRIMAIPSSGYQFVEWTDSAVPYITNYLSGDTHVVISGSLPASDINAHAVFELIPQAEMKIYFGKSSVRNSGFTFTEFQNKSVYNKHSTIKAVLTEWDESYNGEYVVIAHPADWFTLSSISVNFENSSLSFPLTYRTTQEYNGVNYRVYTSALSQYSGGTVKIQVT